MMDFSHLKISTRLGAGFALVIVLGLVVALLGRWQLQTISGQLHALSTEEMVKVEHATQTKDNINEIARAIRNQAH